MALFFNVTQNCRAEETREGSKRAGGQLDVTPPPPPPPPPDDAPPLLLLLPAAAAASAAVLPDVGRGKDGGRANSLPSTNHMREAEVATAAGETLRDSRA